jgi:hypothetical protein
LSRNVGTELSLYAV